jgi:hypothetical protein
MKFLRLLAITIFLNIPCAHAMEQSSMIPRLAKSILYAAGMTMLVDGGFRASVGDSLLLSTPKITNDKHVNDMLSRVAGAVEAGAGVALAVYTLD